MLKVALLLKRAPSVDQEAFASEWIEAGLGVIERLRASEGALRYAQNHPLSPDSPFAGAEASTYDGAEEYWFETEAAARRYFSTADAHGLANRSMLDLAACCEVSGTAYPIRDGEPKASRGTVKIFPCGARKPGLSVAEFRHLWIDVHGPLALANPGGTDRLQRLEYCPADELKITGLPVAPFDSSAGIWMDDLEHLFVEMKSDYYRDVLGPDEQRFNDKERSFAMIVAERCLWDLRSQQP